MRQILIFCFLLVFPAVIRAEKTLKVACVGNSITYEQFVSGAAAAAAGRGIPGGELRA